MRPPVRHAARAFGPALLGAAYATALVALEYRGHPAPARSLALALAWAAPLGATLGAAAGAVAHLRARAPRRRRPDATATRATVALLAGWHVVASLWAMAARPALAADAWYARGGVRRLVQVLATDLVGPGALAALGAVALGAYVVGARPWRLASATLGARPRRLAAPDGPSRRTRLLRPTLACAAVALAATAALIATERPRRAGAAGGKPNVVLVGFASLGADALTPEGMPSLHGLATQSIAFDQALVSTTDAAAARATWLSGVEPYRRRAPGLGAGEPLPARLAAAGYRTAIAGDDALAARLGAPSAGAPGLERWPLALEPLRPLAKFVAARLGLAPPARRDFGDADDVVDVALRFIDEAEAPFAVALFLPGGRAPFPASCSRALAFTDRAYRGPCKYRSCAAGPHDPHAGGGERGRTADLRRGALACDDDAFGRLLEGLRTRGLAETTIVSAFGDGGPGGAPAGAAGALDDRALRVPLLIRPTRGAPPAERHELVRDVDLAPTIGDLLGLGAPAGRAGRSLAASLRGEPLPPRPALAEDGAATLNDGAVSDALASSHGAASAAPASPGETFAGGAAPRRRLADGAASNAPAPSVLGRRWALTAGPHRLLGRATRQGLAVELFDRIADPDQTRDLSADAPALRDEMRETLLGLLLRDRGLALRFGHVVPRPPPAPRRHAAAPAPGAATHERTYSLLDVLHEADIETVPLDGRSPSLSTLPPDPWAASPVHPDRRRVTLVAADGRHETRDALVVRAPSTLRLPWRPGRGARLRVAPALLAPPDTPLTVEVLAAPPGGRPERLGAWPLGADEASHWNERDFDLARFAGLDLELEFRASTPAGDGPAVAWGSPAVFEAATPALPYNVVLLAVEAPDDAAPPAATTAGVLAPLVSRGVVFSDATPAATRREPELLALLSGLRPGELGLDVAPRSPSKSGLDAFYARRPPLLATRLRREGVTTVALRDQPRAGSAVDEEPDLGFDSLVSAAQTPGLFAEAASWLQRHRRERFFALLQPRASSVFGKGPSARDVRSTANAPLETLLDALRDLDLERQTVVALAVVPGGRGARAGAAERSVAGARSPIADARAPATGSPTFIAEARTSVADAPDYPLVFVVPGRPPTVRSDVPAHATDVAPTLLALEGLAPDARTSGLALLGADGHDPPAPPGDRARMTEGPGGRALRQGPWVYVERDATAGRGPARAALLDRREGARARDRSSERPEVLERSRDELARQLSRHLAADASRSEALAGSRFSPPPPSPRALVRLRFYGGGASRRVALRLEKPAHGPGDVAPALRVTPVGLDPAVLYDGPTFVDAALVTPPDDAVGFDLELAPSTTPLSWQVSWDDRPLEANAWLAGPYGLALPSLAAGLRDEASRRFAEAPGPPADLSPGRDEAVLVWWQELPDGIWPFTYIELYDLPTTTGADGGANGRGPGSGRARKRIGRDS